MLDPKLKDKVSLGYQKLGDLAYQIALNLRKGKDHTHRQKELWNQAIILRAYLSAILRHVEFSDTVPPVLYNITEKQVNSWIRVITTIGEIEKYPIVPALTMRVKPILLTKGPKGDKGDAGDDGIDANILVEPAAGETDIFVTTEIVGGVKKFLISHNTYTAPAVTVSIQGTKVFEIGTSQNFNVTISTTKGRNNITALTLLNPSGLDASLQSLINLSTLNGVSQPVNTVLPVTGVVNNTTYQAQVTDGTTPITAQDQATFVYPFLYGNRDVLIFDKYTLSKTIAAKSNRSFLLNATNEYFFIGYPSSYGVLQSIKDQNGFDVTSAFETFLENVTSNSLANNWTTEYRFYRTSVKTTIVNSLYSITFP